MIVECVYDHNPSYWTVWCRHKPPMKQWHKARPIRCVKRPFYEHLIKNRFTDKCVKGFSSVPVSCDIMYCAVCKACTVT